MMSHVPTELAVITLLLQKAAGGAPLATAAPEIPVSAPPTGSAKTHDSLVGVVIRKSVTAELESWNVTGWDHTCRDLKFDSYLVLDTGGAPPKQRSAAEGVTLIGAGGATHLKLESKAGKRIRIYGDYVAGRDCAAEKPSPTYPRGPDGKFLPRGAYFRVLAIEDAE